jgi:hypothetical protein
MPLGLSRSLTAFRKPKAASNSYAQLGGKNENKKEIARALLGWLEKHANHLKNENKKNKEKLLNSVNRRMVSKKKIRQVQTNALLKKLLNGSNAEVANYFARNGVMVRNANWVKNIRSKANPRYVPTGNLLNAAPRPKSPNLLLPTPGNISLRNNLKGLHNNWVPRTPSPKHKWSTKNMQVYTGNRVRRNTASPHHRRRGSGVHVWPGNHKN